MAPARVKEIAENYLAALGVVALGYLLYATQPYLVKLYTAAYHEWLLYIVWFYVLVLPFYYLSLPANYPVKCRLFWRGLWNYRSRNLLDEERVAIRTIVIKLFFLPMMLAWVVYHWHQVVSHGMDFLRQPAFLPSGYWFLFNLAFLVDVSCFLIGYAIEHPRLGNEIRSVEPTAAGWLATLACYPPLNEGMQRLFAWQSSDYPHFNNEAVQLFACVAILLAMGIYAWASCALFLKASNLTHRGVVMRGPYRWVRHPAYASKNVAWWLGSLPALMFQWQVGFNAWVYAVMSVAAWSALYYWRAITEERHLSRDPMYQDYCRRVPSKFIPGVW